MLLKLLATLLRLCGFVVKITDGKKTIAGALITAIGIACFFIPGTNGYAIEFLVLGIPILITGITHKIVKAKNGKVVL
jgi:uncharacterized membrane protein HdeD (DUF308 family)